MLTDSVFLCDGSLTLTQSDFYMECADPSSTISSILTGCGPLTISSSQVDIWYVNYREEK